MKNFKISIIIIAFITLIIVVSMYLNKNDSITKAMPKKTFQSIDISSGENIYTYNSFIYTYGKAGLKIFKDEKLLINDKFTLENPYVATSYDKLAITDKNSKVLRVYSSSGNIYTINAPNIILGFNINKNGSCAIILKMQDSYQIDVYDKQGELIYSIKDISYLEGIPVSVSISENDNILAVSFIKTTGATIDSNIVLYSINDTEVFGGFIKNNQFVGLIKFLNNTNLIGFSEKEIFIIKTNETTNQEQAKEIYQKPLNNILNYVKFLDGVGYLVCYGDKTTSSQDAIRENEIIFYNNNGGNIAKYYNKDKLITNIWANKFGAIIAQGRNFIGLDTSGNKLWEYQATQDIKNVLFYNNKNCIAIETNDKIKIVKIDKTLFDAQIDENNLETTTDAKSENNETTTNTQTKETTTNKDLTKTTTNKTTTTTKETTTTTTTTKDKP